MVLAMGCPFYFAQHLLGTVGRLAQDQEHQSGFPYRLGDLARIGSPTLDITWCHPARHSLGLKRSADSLGDSVVVARVRQKHRVRWFRRLRFSRAQAICLVHCFAELNLAVAKTNEVERAHGSPPGCDLIPENRVVDRRLTTRHP
jgi:hypothetical protein